MTRHATRERWGGPQPGSNGTQNGAQGSRLATYQAAKAHRPEVLVPDLQDPIQRRDLGREQNTAEALSCRLVQATRQHVSRSEQIWSRETLTSRSTLSSCPMTWEGVVCGEGGCAENSSRLISRVTHACTYTPDPTHCIQHSVSNGHLSSECSN